MPRRRIYWRVPSKKYAFEGVGWAEVSWEGEPTVIYLDSYRDGQTTLPIFLSKQSERAPPPGHGESGTREAEGSRDD